MMFAIFDQKVLSAKCGFFKIIHTEFENKKFDLSWDNGRKCRILYIGRSNIRNKYKKEDIIYV